MDFTISVIPLPQAPPLKFLLFHEKQIKGLSDSTLISLTAFIFKIRAVLQTIQ